MGCRLVTNTVAAVKGVDRSGNKCGEGLRAEAKKEEPWVLGQGAGALYQVEGTAGGVKWARTV